MHLLIVNHYATTPDFPGGTRHYDLAKDLVLHGHDVTVIAAGFNYATHKETQNYNNTTYHAREYEGIRWIWVKTPPYFTNGVARLRNMIVFSQRIRKIIKHHDVPFDIIIGSTVHPFASWAASKIAQRRKCPFVFEIRDLWPQTMIDNHLWKTGSLQARLFFFLENLTVKRADAFIILSPLTKTYLEDRYKIPSDKITLIPNGTAITDMKKNLPADNIVRFMYLGGIDKVHKLDDVIAALSVIKGEKNIAFEFVGDGKERKMLIKACDSYGIHNVTWTPSVPKKMVPGILSRADVLVLSTSTVMYGSENKLAEYLMAGKPILTYTPAIHNNPAIEHNCGLTAAYGNINDLAETIRAFAAMSAEQRAILGKNSRSYAEKNLSIQILAEKFENTLLNIRKI